MEGISRRELARRQGISEGAVRKAIIAGVLEGCIYADGSLDGDKAADALAAVITTGRHAPIFLTAARTRRLRAQVRLFHDQVMEKRATLVPIDAAAALTGSQVDYMTPLLERMSQRGAKAAAGKPHREALDALKNTLYDTLEDIQKGDPKTPGRGPDDAPVDEPDFERMSPVALTAAIMDYKSELMELERLLARGELLHVEDVGVKFNEGLAVFKSLLFAMPGRVAAYMGEATPNAARRIIWEETKGALANLREAIA